MHHTPPDDILARLGYKISHFLEYSTLKVNLKTGLVFKLLEKALLDLHTGGEGFCNSGEGIQSSGTTAHENLTATRGQINIWLERLARARAHARTHP